MPDAVLTYCVVGVRADRTRRVMSAKLSLDDARYLRRVLASANIFAHVVIQLDEPNAALGPRTDATSGNNLPAATGVARFGRRPDGGP